MQKLNLFYKTIALYLLNRAKSPLSGTHICEFLVNSNYTDYFTARNILVSLEDSDMIESIPSSNTTMYRINDLGVSTLDAMKDRINEDDMNNTALFLSEHSIPIRSNRDLYADYDRSTRGGYIVHLRSCENGIPIIDLTLNIGNEDQARTICTNWKKNHTKLYQTLLDILM